MTCQARRCQLNPVASNRRIWRPADSTFQHSVFLTHKSTFPFLDSSGSFLDECQDIRSTSWLEIPRFHRNGRTPSNPWAGALQTKSLVSSSLEGTKSSALLTDMQNVAKGRPGRVCEPRQRCTAPGQRGRTDWAYKQKIQFFRLFAPHKLSFLILQNNIFLMKKETHMHYRKYRLAQRKTTHQRWS